MSVILGLEVLPPLLGALVGAPVFGLLHGVRDVVGRDDSGLEGNDLEAVATLGHGGDMAEKVMLFVCEAT